ncbi:MAG: hypothetical protein EAZ24_13045, partial [Burkholderiales bacterium]
AKAAVVRARSVCDKFVARTSQQHPARNLNVPRRVSKMRRVCFVAPAAALNLLLRLAFTEAALSRRSNGE